MEDLTSLLLGTNEEPVLVVLEDLHWIDPSTNEWLDYISRQLVNHQILILITSRPMDKYPEWVNDSHVKHYPLNPLKKSEIKSICEYRSSGVRLPSMIIDQIIKRTEGNPLFAEEVTIDLLESVKRTEDESIFVDEILQAKLRVPPTLQDSLMSRLDRLSTGKELAQIGSIIGREFSFMLIRELQTTSDKKLDSYFQNSLRLGYYFKRG